MEAERKTVWGWALYDWANSAFATTVMAGFFPVFFKLFWSHGSDINVSTAQLGFGNAGASLLVAFMAPILGAIADRASRRKTFLLSFAYLGVLMTAALFWVQQGEWAWAILIYALGVVGFSLANVFSDSLLPSVAPEEKIDTISCFGFSMGYLGGGLLLLVNVLMVLMPTRFGLSDSGEAIRYAFLSVAFWWGCFTLFTVFWVPEDRGRAASASEQGAVLAGARQLIRTFRKVRHMKSVLLFLLAYWFYIDGVDTIIRMAVDYGMSLGFAYTDLLLALLLVQFVGFPAALAFGVLAERWGVRKAIFLAITIYMGITLWGTLMTHKTEFYLLAVVIGLVQGGIQALSRSYYARLIPKDQAAEFYGFYNMLGKFAAILGPALMGGVGLLVKRILLSPHASPDQVEQIGRTATRLSMGSVLLLFLIGGVLFYFVDEEKGKAELAFLREGQ